MLGFGNKKKAKIKFEEEVKNYDETVMNLNKKIDWLHYEKERTYYVLKNVETYLNMLKNTPEKMILEFNSAKLEISTFEKEIDVIKKELEKIEFSAVTSGAKTAAAGVAAGTTVVGFAPSAAMAVATTFGTASTGAAISSLSGAAATNAALAWLGGGAVVAGGGGTAAGTALLALAGPIGWAIGGTGLIFSGLSINGKNKQAVEKYNEEVTNIRKEIVKLKLISAEIDRVGSGLQTDRDILKSKLSLAQDTYPKNYDEMNNDQRLYLGAIVNQLRVTSKKINEKIEVENIVKD